jgi:GxxExxY protein
MQYKELTEKIIGCAYKVYNKMGFGFVENIYEKCLHIELKKAGLNFEIQKPIAVSYDDQVVGDFYADIIVNNEIIIELKSVKRIIKNHEIQLVNYLVATGKPLGLLLNFGENSVHLSETF